jgi:hypothetical protein
MILKNELEFFQSNTSCNLNYSWVDYRNLDIVDPSGAKIASLSMNYVREKMFVDNWFGLISDTQFREILSGAFLFYFQKSNCCKRICNSTDLKGVMDEETSAWFQNVMMKKLVAAGLRYNAIVISKDQPAHNLNDKVTRKEETLDRQFQSMDEAITWQRSIVDSNLQLAQR